MRTHQFQERSSFIKNTGTFFKPIIQKKLSVGSVHDSYEAEADHVADKVMKTSESLNQSTQTGVLIQKKCAHCEQEEKLQMKPLTESITPLIQHTSVENAGESNAPSHIESKINSSRGNGNIMDDGTKNFMENRFGTDFSNVKIHTGSEAVQMSRELNAQAFAVGNDIYFNEGKYKPNSNDGKHLLAHELTHTVQQNNSIRRKLQIKPPGKGEASAFDRVQELIDRLNSLSPAIKYQLNTNDLNYSLIDEKNLTGFDKQFKAFIDKPEVVPMRLINSQGLLKDGSGNFTINVFADSAVTAYVDLDDLLADDVFSFQSDLVHFLTERFAIKNYDKRVGDASMGASAVFDPAHKKGKDAEAEYLRDLLKDPSINFNYEEIKGTTFINAFKSKTQGYRVFQIVKNFNKAIAGGNMFIQFKGEKMIPLADYLRDNPK